MNPLIARLSRGLLLVFIVSLPLVRSADAQSVSLNPGFETTSTNFPGNAQNWYGYVTGVDTFSAITQWPYAVYAGTNSFLLEPHTQGTNDLGEASLGSDLWPVAPGSTNRLSFQLKAIGSTATSTWGKFVVGFYNSSFSPISYSADQGFPYDWGNWTNVVLGNLVAPSNTSYIGVSFYAYALDGGGSPKLAQWSVDDVFLYTSASSPYADWVSYWQTNSSGFSDTAQAADPDGDGFNNASEYAFGGNPTVGTPALLTARSAGGGVYVDFLACTNAVDSYQVLVTTNLASGSWLVDGSLSVTNSADQGGLPVPSTYVRRAFSVPSIGNRFFRISSPVPAP